MIKKIFSISKSDKKSRKKALEQLDDLEGRLDASEVLGGKVDEQGKEDFFIKIQSSSQINSSYQNLDDIS
jgi:hypothetical protein